MEAGDPLMRLIRIAGRIASHLGFQPRESTTGGVPAIRSLRPFLLLFLVLFVPVGSAMVWTNFHTSFEQDRVGVSVAIVSVILLMLILPVVVFLGASPTEKTRPWKKNLVTATLSGFLCIAFALHQAWNESSLTDQGILLYGSGVILVILTLGWIRFLGGDRMAK